MDTKTKGELLKFIGTGLEQVGDLATWIQAPQRRYHRHEFFGIDAASLTLASSKRTYSLRDIGYGGCGMVGGDPWPSEKLGSGAPFEATIKYLDQSFPFNLTVRHIQNLHVGCEFTDMTNGHVQFLKSFIQYMDAALQIRQADPSTVFSAFREREWLNLIGHRGSLRFHIRRAEGRDGFEATLVFVLSGNHTYCVWKDDKLDIGFLNGDFPAGGDRTAMLRQIVSLLIGIRQGASLPDFSPIIERVMGLVSLQRP